MNRVNILSLTLLCTLLSYPLSGFTLSTDRDQPIKIQADKLDINDTTHISIYQGNVDMRQGSLHIQADSIIFHFTPNNDLEKLEIEGSPAILNQLNDKNEKISGTAKKIIYTDNLLLLKLTGDAQFKNNADTIESEWISINTQSDALKAGSTTGENRVHMLIQPRNSPNTGPKIGNNNKK